MERRYTARRTLSVALKKPREPGYIQYGLLDKEGCPCRPISFNFPRFLHYVPQPEMTEPAHGGGENAGTEGSGHHRPVQTAMQDEIAVSLCCFCGGGQVDVGRAGMDIPDAFSTRFYHRRQDKKVSCMQNSGTCLRYSWSHGKAQRRGFAGLDHSFSYAGSLESPIPQKLI